MMMNDGIKDAIECVKDAMECTAVATQCHSSSAILAL